MSRRFWRHFIVGHEQGRWCLVNFSSAQGLTALESQVIWISHFSRLRIQDPPLFGTIGGAGLWDQIVNSSIRILMNEGSEWLLKAGVGMDESIGAIESMRQRLGSDYRRAIIHRDIAKSQFVQDFENLRILGAYHSDGTIIDQSKIPNRTIVMNLYRRGSIIRLLSQFIYRSHLGLLQTIDGIDSALKNGNFLVLLILLTIKFKKNYDAKVKLLISSH